MATTLKTIGTTAQTTLVTMPFGTDQNVADIAQIAANIKDDQVNGHPIWPGAWANTGLLFIPNRGVLQVRPGDYVAYDATGWPILISKLAAASASWVHT
jgi:hypothetical protein